MFKREEFNKKNQRKVQRKIVTSQSYDQTDWFTAQAISTTLQANQYCFMDHPNTFFFFYKHHPNTSMPHIFQPFNTLGLRLREVIRCPIIITLSKLGFGMMLVSVVCEEGRLSQLID